MTAADVLKYASGNGASTTLSSSITNSDTSAPLTSDTNFSAKSGEGMVIIDEGQSSEEYAYATTKSGAALTIPLANRGLEGGSAQSHPIQATVKGIISAGMWNAVIDALKNVVLKTTGALDTTKVVDLATSQALTNKDLTSSTNTIGQHPRTNTTTSSATPSINTDTTDIFTITALAAAITSMTTNLSGTPVNGQKLTIRIKDDGTARAITWGASFVSRGANLPATTTISKVTYVGLIYNSTASVWDCVAAITEA